MKLAPRLLSLASVLGVAACAEPTDGAAETERSIDARLAELPSWSEFSPPLADVEPQPVEGETPVYYEETDQYEIITEDAVEVVSDAIYNCVSIPYTMTDTPEDIVMLSPDLELLWPGALLQGRSHRDGLGSLDPLPIAERAPIEISIPAIASEGNFRTVESPTQAQVASAIGAIIGDAVAADIVTPSSISYEENTFSSEQQFALSIDASGRYLGFSASAGVDVNSTQTRNTIAAQFYQKMYEVVVAPPETPGALFSDAFTGEDYDAQASLDRIGPDNLPIYVSNVVYGRMMTFSMTSTASEDELRAILNASYEALVGGVQLEVEGRDKQILETAEISIATLGGGAEGALEMIRTGNLRDYFTTDAPLSSAAPLSYTFRNLGDNSIAGVSEAIEYSVTECTARLPGEIFDVVPEQVLPAPVPVPYTAAAGDFNGDGVDDVVWNHLGVDSNVYAFGYGSPLGSFTASATYTHASNPGVGWPSFDLHVGDFDGDGVDELLWNQLVNGNDVYVARLDGSTWTHETRDIIGALSWDEYELFIGDVDGIPGDDLVWNSVGLDSPNHTEWVGGWAPGVGFGPRTEYEHDLNCCWSAFDRLLGDVNADGLQDLLMYRPLELIGSPPIPLIGEVRQLVATDHGFVSGDSSYQLVPDFAAALGDINGDGRDDLVQVSDDAFPISLATDCGTPDCGATFTFTSVSGDGFDLLAQAPEWTLADVNGDGLSDVVLYRVDGTTQEIQVGFADGDGGLYPSPLQQSPFEVLDWAPFDLLLGDFDGNGATDLLWHQSGASARLLLEASHAPQ